MAVRPAILPSVGLWLDQAALDGSTTGVIARHLAGV